MYRDAMEHLARSPDISSSIAEKKLLDEVKQFGRNPRQLNARGLSSATMERKKEHATWPTR
jgi:uncharacterized protein (DUF2384 family)